MYSGLNETTPIPSVSASVTSALTALCDRPRAEVMINGDRDRARHSATSSILAGSDRKSGDRSGLFMTATCPAPLQVFRGQGQGVGPRGSDMAMVRALSMTVSSWLGFLSS